MGFFCFFFTCILQAYTSKSWHMALLFTSGPMMPMVLCKITSPFCASFHLTGFNVVCKKTFDFNNWERRVTVTQPCTQTNNKKCLMPFFLLRLTTSHLVVELFNQRAWLLNTSISSLLLLYIFFSISIQCMLTHKTCNCFGEIQDPSGVIFGSLSLVITTELIW